MRELQRSGQRKRKNSVDSNSVKETYQSWRSQLLLRLRTSTVEDAASGKWTERARHGGNRGAPTQVHQVWRSTSIDLAPGAGLASSDSVGEAYAALAGALTIRSAATGTIPTRGTRLPWTQALVTGVIESLSSQLARLQQPSGAPTLRVDRENFTDTFLSRRTRCCSSALLRLSIYGLGALGLTGFLARLAAMAWGGIAAGSFAFLALTLTGWLVVSALWRKDADACAVARLAVLISGYCMWLMWLMCYMDQMNPIIRPLRKV
jgi:hypothetical protein